MGLVWYGREWTWVKVLACSCPVVFIIAHVFLSTFKGFRQFPPTNLQQRQVVMPLLYGRWGAEAVVGSASCSGVPSGCNLYTTSYPHNSAYLEQVTCSHVPTGIIFPPALRLGTVRTVTKGYGCCHSGRGIHCTGKFLYAIKTLTIDISNAFECHLVND